MIRTVVSFLTLVLALLLCVQSTSAQEQAPPPAEKQAAEEALREKAFKLLESLADQLGNLQSAENRARIGSNIADSLWTHDEARARALFKVVEDDIKLGLQKPENDREAERTFEVFLKLREDNVERIARHDPEMALAFLRETLPLIHEATRYGNGVIPENVKIHEQALELRLAKKIGSANAEISVQLARQSLKHGLSDDLLPLLARLNRKNKTEAQGLYQDVVRKIDESDFDENSPAVPFAQRLLVELQPPFVDESNYKELVDVFLKKAFANGCDRPKSQQAENENTFCEYVGEILPLLEKYSGKTSRLRQWLPQQDAGTLVESAPVPSLELSDLIENGTIDEVLELGAKYPQMRAQIYASAMQRAENERDFELAKKIADKFGRELDPEERARLNRRVENYSAAEKQLEDILRQVRKNPYNLAPQLQAEQLMALADFAATRNKKFAVKVLAEIEAIANGLKPGDSQTKLQMSVASLYCLAQDEHGFGMMESLLPRLNDLVAAAVKLDGYDTRYLRDNEWNMSASGSLGNILTTLSGNAGAFAWSDFDRAVTLAGQFERSEIRMMAQLKLAQGILAGPPKTIMNRSSSGFYSY